MESSARINILDEIPTSPLDLAGLRLRIWKKITLKQLQKKFRLNNNERKVCFRKVCGIQ